ncbi:MAG: helix-turn-helix domain-containing protein [Clostridiales bacterium]|nr:helix-turn-helix domain-containing protein [Clostridiales bacterium]
MADVRDEKLAKLIGRNISNLLLKRGKSQKDLCDNLGFSPASVSSWVNGTRIPKEGNIVLMAAYLDCSVDDIALDPKEAHRKRSFSIPVYARVGAGPPLEASEEIIDREEISERMASLGNFYGLRISGDSMEPRIVRGDVVIVRKQDTADDGDIVIAIVNQNDAVCKRLKKYKGGIALVSNNPMYEPMYFTITDTQDIPVRIIGKVVELRGKL